MEKYQNEYNTTTGLEEAEKVLTFAVGEQIYGIEIPYVIEIIGIQHITELPNMPNSIKGIMNVRGKIIPVMDIRSRFGKEEIPYDDFTCIIIISVDDDSLGIIVDRVEEVINVTADDIADTPDYKSVNASKYIDYIVDMNGGIKLVLDCRILIETKDVATISED